jgi:hypothetical protein
MRHHLSNTAYNGEHSIVQVENAPQGDEMVGEKPAWNARRICTVGMSG